MARNWKGTSWGSWHVGTGATCPQGDGRHSLAEATNLNEKVREFSRARAWARHKEWIGQQKAPRATVARGASSSSSPPSVRG